MGSVPCSAFVFAVAHTGSSHLRLCMLQLIKGSESLKKLGLSNNEIGKVGCQALTAAISSNQSLKHLQLLPGRSRPALGVPQVWLQCAYAMWQSNVWIWPGNSNN
jgi:predicted DCC family thiol-disulfide oxidoreductase YuxK